MKTYLSDTMEEQEQLLYALGKGRMESLSDGVFAIAMTLLMFNMKPPDMDVGASVGQLATSLIDQWPIFATYLFSFISLGIYWVAHNTQFQRIHVIDRTVLWMNIHFLLFVGCIPFSTQLVAKFHSNHLALALFSINLMLIGATLYMIWSYVGSKRGYLSAEVTPQLQKLLKLRLTVVPGVAFTSIIISIWSTNLSAASYLVLLPLYLAPGRMDRIDERALRGEPAIKPFHGVRRRAS